MPDAMADFGEIGRAVARGEGRRERARVDPTVPGAMRGGLRDGLESHCDKTPVFGPTRTRAYDGPRGSRRERDAPAVALMKPRFQGRSILEAAPGLEPGMRDLQSAIFEAARE